MKASRTLCVSCKERPPRDVGMRCLFCLKPRAWMHWTPVHRCWDCGAYISTARNRCPTCSAARGYFTPRVATDAHKVVRAAIITGVLPPAKSLRCADCGAQAQQYDHRDYSKPLDVDPVCRSCNAKRGCAIQTRPKFGPLSNPAGFRA